ncbi:MAG: hypothetical protein ABEJ04_07020 [Halobacteriaceae archaeon]
MRWSPALFAALLVAVGVVQPLAVAHATDALGAGGGSDAAVGSAPRATLTPPNTTAMLPLPGGARTAFVTPTVALSPALRSQYGDLASGLSRYALDERLAAARSPDARRDVLYAALSRASRRVDRLGERERTARGAFANGTVAPDAYVRTLAELDAASSEFDPLVARVLAATDNVSETDAVERRARLLRADFAVLGGPVRSHVDRALQGRAERGRVYVAATRDGVVLSMVANGTYVREIYRADNRDAATGATDVGTARDRFTDLYPWAANHSAESLTRRVDADTFRFTSRHSHGTLVSYLDGSTSAVYREVQYLSLAAVPTYPAVRSRRSDLSVAVNRTYPGGPLRVRVLEDGAPVDATVRVNGTVVDRTGEDGVLWTVSPAHEFVVTVSRGDVQLPVIVAPVRDGSEG